MKFTQAEIAGLYNQGSAHGASPLGLVVALYDTILRDLSRASEAVAQGNIEKRTFELNHALRVIAELENVLDFEQGGDAAKRLKNFYVVTRGMILDASVKNSREALSQLWDIFATMRKAWNEAEQKMKSGGVALPGGPPATQSNAAPAAQTHTSLQGDARATAKHEAYAQGEPVSRGSWSA